MAAVEGEEAKDEGFLRLVGGVVSDTEAPLPSRKARAVCNCDRFSVTLAEVAPPQSVRMLSGKATQNAYTSWNVCWF